VRLEIGTALERKSQVIPLLLNGASMPKRSDLPDILKTLPGKEDVEIRSDRFESDVKDFIAFLKGHSKKIATKERVRVREGLYKGDPIRIRRSIAFVVFWMVVLVGPLLYFTNNMAPPDRSELVASVLLVLCVVAGPIFYFTNKS
jgi:hypothetical protein